MSVRAASCEVEYPSSDGKPMAETWLHVQAIMLLHQALEDFFAGRADVLVASDMFWYWQEGNPAACIAPDVLVATGLVPRDPQGRRSYFSWQEGGVVPSVVFELASQNTWRADVEEKYERYEALGVREYFLFDPEGLYLSPSLRGYRLSGSVYEGLSGEVLASEQGFGVRGEGAMLRLIDLRSGQPVPTRAEAVAAEREKAAAERRKAAAERRKAEEERRKAEESQLEVERLRELLRKFGHSDGTSS